MKNIPKPAFILLSIALIALIADFCILANIDNGELIIPPDEQAQYEFNYHETCDNTYYICTPKDTSLPQKTDTQLTSFSLLLNAELTERPINANITRPNEGTKEVTFTTSPPRQLTLPQNIQTKYSLENDVYDCAESESLTINPGTVSLPLKPDTLVIDAFSHSKNISTVTALFILFLISLFGGIGILCKRCPVALPTIRFYDAPLVFVLALTLALGFQFGFEFIFPSDNTLLPGFSTMLNMACSNCLGFLIAVGIFLFIHRKADPQQSPKQEQSIIVPVVAAFILAFTGIIDVLFSPIPVLEPIEMAQNLASPRFVHAFLAVLAGIYEELLFRGIIQTALMPGPNSKRPMLANINAVTITTVLFVLLHVPQSLEHAWALLPIGLVSIASGILRIRSGSIFQSILLHMSYNTLLLLASLMRPSTLI